LLGLISAFFLNLKFKIMNTNDMMICTFADDKATPAADFVAEITAVNASASSFDCSLVDTGQQFTFNYGSDPWTGKDSSGGDFALVKHDIFTGGKTDPAAQGLAVVAFPDNKRYLGYVKTIDPSLDIVFYQSPTPELSIESNSITKSNWDAYPVGSQISSIEGYNKNDDLPTSSETDDSSTSESSARTDASSSTDTDATPDTTPATTGESQRILIVDVYQGDLGGKPAWDVLINAPNFFGAIIKASEGTYYDGGVWFKKNWPAVKEISNDRYGKTWFRGAYLFLKFNRDGVKQADYYLTTINAAGGWDKGDIIPIVDVELGGDGKQKDGSIDPKKRNSNQDASAQQIIDCTSACAERLRSQTGRQIMLYGRGAMRDRGINNKMKCDIVWNPCYTSKIVMNGLQAWNLDDVALWQYCGDGIAALDESKYPRSIPGFGKVDISVYIDGANKPTLDTLISRLGIGTVQG
jgi:GH25 family lysozyme M1 (1,4-beta-N-acetylmuramidase)